MSSILTSFMSLRGDDFEREVTDFLNEYGFEARKTGSNDGGIDIVAKCVAKGTDYTFNIQCKYFNNTIGKAPIQEVYTGTAYYGNGGFPVVITNNRVTAEARVFAKRLGVEIIADAEWTEIFQVMQTKKVINPNVHKGVMGILIAYITRDRDYLVETAAAIKGKAKPITDKEELRLELVNDFDEAEVYIKEAAYLHQRAAECSQKALSLQKKALLRNLDYG